MTPQVGVPLRLLALANAPLGVYVHWLQNPKQRGGGRTVPHTTPDDTCPICVEQNQRPRWHGYLACWWEHSSRFVVADLSLHAVQSCPELVPSHPFPLRGCYVTLSRIGKSNNSPVKATVMRSTIAPTDLPEPFDVRAALMRMWGLSPSEHLREDDLEGRE
jgi:hypothetical protein